MKAEAQEPITLEDFESSDPLSAQRVARAAAKLRAERPEVVDVSESIQQLREDLEDEIAEAKAAGPADEALLRRFVDSSATITKIEALRISHTVETFRAGSRRVEYLDLNSGNPKGTWASEHRLNTDFNFLDSIAAILAGYQAEREAAERAAITNAEHDRSQVALLEQALEVHGLGALIETAAELASLQTIPPDYTTPDLRALVLPQLQTAVFTWIRLRDELRELELPNFWQTFALLRGVSFTQRTQFQEQYTSSARLVAGEPKTNKKRGIFAFTRQEEAS